MTTQPIHPCDLVMQGAVASGVVYPPVILELKDHYRFRNIGGTSAGAIAAAGAAAAEYNREDCGFTHLAHMSDWLGADHHLRDLFQPSADTKPLMNLVDVIFPPYQPLPEDKQTGNKPNAFQSALQTAGRLIYIWATRYPRFSWIALGGIVIGILLALLLSLAVFGFVSLLVLMPVAWVAWIPWLVLAIFAILGIWLGWQVGGVIDAITKLPGNFYGICCGHSDAVPNVLTDWLSDQLNKMAGLKEDKLLTFGDLKDKQPQNGQDADIILRMITSNLSQGRPLVLPSDLKGFVFKEDDMRKLFPDYVVKHMVTHAAENPLIPKDKLPKDEGYHFLPDGYYFLPDEDKLPVVVAMRLSLSFPILLSAVPLYTISALAVQGIKDGTQSEVHKPDLQPNWFSDGGICNNFPIEFFDAWLPRWPTFGIDLTSMPAKSFEDGNQQPVSSPNLSTAGPAQIVPMRLSRASLSALDPNYERRTTSQGLEAVYLPRADAPQDPVWRDLQGIVAFLSAILGTGLGWQRTLQTNLPSYRDRVVQIRMSEAEDGLHLNMPPNIIKELGDKGQAAGQLLSKFDFEQHQWVRFRVLMAKLEENFEKSQATVLSSAPEKPSTLEKLLDAQASAYRNDPYPYKEEPQWCDEAKARVNKLRDPIEFWRNGTPRLFREDAPKPDTALRVTPEI